MDTEDPKQQQTSDYSKEFVTTLITIGLVIIFFVTKDMKPEGNGARGVVNTFGVVGFLFLQIMAIGMQLSLAVLSWMSKNETAKTVYMIISILIIGIVLLALLSIK